jgi:hypothetical protein
MNNILEMQQYTSVLPDSVLQGDFSFDAGALDHQAVYLPLSQARPAVLSGCLLLLLLLGGGRLIH